MHILLVEDEPSFRQVVMDMLMLEGFDVCEAETGDQAASLIEKPSEKFSLLITDIDLPGKRDGFGVASLMHQLHPALPLIYMTGKPDVVKRLSSKEVLLLKPFKLQKLLRMIQDLLADE